MHGLHKWELNFIVCLVCVFTLLTETNAQIMLTGKDSTSTMRIRMGFQGRYEFVDPETGPSISKTSLERARFLVAGQAFMPQLSYFLQLSLEPNQRDIAATDPNKSLLDAWVQYRFSDGFSARVGQFIMPVLRQGFTSIMFQQFTDRSQVANTFTYNRDVGILLMGKKDIGGIIFKPYYMFVTGDGRSFLDISANTGNQHIFRLEILTGGEFATADGYSESDLDREGHPKGQFGIGYEINSDPIRQRGNAGSFIFETNGSPLDGQIKSFFVDAQIKYKGFSTLFEYINRSSDNAAFISGSGYNFQIGYITISNLELGLRYSKLDLDNAEFDLKERRIVITRYFRQHNLKLTSELGKVNNVSDDETLSFRMLFTVFI